MKIIIKTLLASLLLGCSFASQATATSPFFFWLNSYQCQGTDRFTGLPLMPVYVSAFTPIGAALAAFSVFHGRAILFSISCERQINP